MKIAYCVPFFNILKEQCKSMTGLEEMGDMEELLEEILAQYDLEVEKIVRTRGGWL